MNQPFKEPLSQGPITVVFCGTPQIASEHLQILFSRPDKFKVIAVLTQPDRPKGRGQKLESSPVKMLAQKHGVPVFQPEKASDPVILETLKGLSPQAAVVVAYGLLLPQKFIDLFPLGIVNVHASLLPQWRGAAPIQRALMAGDKLSGVCLQVLNAKLDAGAVIGKRETQITEEDTAASLYVRLSQLGPELLVQEWVEFLQGKRQGVPQDETLVTWAAKIEKSEGQMDWEHSARVLFNQIRALVMGPGTWTFLQGEKLKIHRVSIEDEGGPRDPLSRRMGQPGRILQVDSHGVLVECGQGVLRILELQPDSRKRMSVEEYLRGHSLKVGEIFNK